MNFFYYFVPFLDICGIHDPDVTRGVLNTRGTTLKKSLKTHDLKCLPLNTFFEKDKVTFILTLFILFSSCNRKEDPFTYTVTPTQRKIKELELEKAYIEKSMYEKKLHTLDIINQSEIRKLEINIQQLTNRLASAKQILERLTVRAPKKGLAIVADSRMTGAKLKVGDNVWSNMPLVIIPETSEMKVKMFVNETDFRSTGAKTGR